MNSTTYSIGGIQIPTNIGYSPAEVYISDNGTGVNQGCRHVRLTFFGSSFPKTINSSGNKLVYIQTFVSGKSNSYSLFYEYSPDYIFPKIICNELDVQGFMSKEIRDADERFGEMMTNLHPEVS